MSKPAYTLKVIECEPGWYQGEVYSGGKLIIRAKRERNRERAIEQLDLAISKYNKQSKTKICLFEACEPLLNTAALAELDECRQPSSIGVWFMRLFRKYFSQTKISK